MARKKRTEVEVERVKSSILNAALDLFDKHDFEQLSMRKIARRANCSVATIYNYYPSKDALYIDVLNNGFEILHGALFFNKDPEHPKNSLRAMSKRFFEFAVQHQNYYNLMFSYPLPKSYDYLGTEVEKAALESRAMAIKTLDGLTHILGRSMERGEIGNFGPPEMLAKMFWAVSHGVISLHHSRILLEVEQDAEGAYNNIIDKFLSFLEKSV